MISSLAAGLETVLRYGRIEDEHAWNGRPLYAREAEKACLHLPNPGVRNPRTRQNASGVCGAVRPRRAHSLWGSAKGRSCEPAQGRVSGPLRDHGAPVQRRAYPTAGQDRGHSSTAAPTSRQPADPNWQSQEDRSPANETQGGPRTGCIRSGGAWRVWNSVGNNWKRSEKPARFTSASAPRSCSAPSFISQKMDSHRMPSGSRHGARPGRASSSYWVLKTRRRAVRAAWPPATRTEAMICVYGCRMRHGRSIWSFPGYAFVMDKSSWRNAWPQAGLCRIASCATPKAGGYSFRWKAHPGNGLATGDGARSASTSISSSWCWPN